MTTYEIPLSAIPYQIVSAVVNGQNYRVTVRQMGDSLFTSLMVDDVIVTECVIARAGASIIPWSQIYAKTAPYWVDTQGEEPPQYSGLGSRWLLCFDGD